MRKIRKFSIQSGLELLTTRMIDEVLTNWTTEAGKHKSTFFGGLGSFSPDHLDLKVYCDVALCNLG